MTTRIIGGIAALAVGMAVATATAAEKESSRDLSGKITRAAELKPSEGTWYSGLALFPCRYAELPGPDCDVYGLRFGLIGSRNRNVGGLDFGSIVNWADGSLNGLSFAGIATVCDSASFGIHFASCVNYAEQTVNGAELALVNCPYGMNGFQLGLVNAVREGSGFQLGFWNMAESYSGFQMGFCNMAMSMRGVQFGLVNLITEGAVTACILLNANF